MPRIIWYFPQERAEQADLSGMYTENGVLYMNMLPDLFIMEVGGYTSKAIISFFNIILLHELTHWAGENHIDEDTGKDMEKAWQWNIEIEKAILRGR